MANLPAKFQRARALHGEGKFSRAQALYQEILAVQPDQLDALMLSGVLAGQTRDFQWAIRLFDKAIAIDPKNPATHCNRGLALQELKRFDEALDSYDRAIALKADYAVAHFNRGAVLKELDRWDAALESYDRALALDPSFVSAHYNRGVLLQELKDWDSALASYNRAITLKRDYADAYNNRGIVFRELGHLEAALLSYNRAIDFEPAHARAHLNRGVTEKLLGRAQEALASYDRAIMLKPDYVEALSNRGVLLASLHRWDEALASYNRAIESDPAYAEAYSGRGLVFAALSRLDEALADYDRAIAIQPDFAQAHFNRSLTLLSRGDLDAGWSGHEWRWRSECSSSIKEGRTFAEPPWLGKESVADRTILIYSEQGLGDTIQFCRYVKLVAGLGARVVFEVQKPLAELLANLEGVSQLVARGDSLPPFDYQCPLMSLPLAFRTILETIPAPIKYLDPGAAKVAELQARLGPKARPRLGLVWSGSATHGNDLNRSIPLAELIQRLPTEFQYFCLQKELRESDRKTLQSHPEIRVLAEELSNFVDTAALCECMDLIISVDTSLAHLSGALGKKTWILLSFISDWRWLRARDDSPWYPTVKLYRQKKIGDWTEVLELVATELIQEFKSS